MCMIEDCYVEFWREKSQRARKEHQCMECGRPVLPGETYWNGFGKSEGNTYDWQCCRHCHIAADWLLANCNGFMCHAVIEDFHEHAEANQLMLRIVVGARRKWRSFGDSKALLPVPTYPADCSDT